MKAADGLDTRDALRAGRQNRRMKACRKLAGAVVLAAVALGAAVSAGSSAELRVGTAAVNIDPPDGIPLAGYYSERGSQGVIDSLFAKAAVLDDGRTQVALVVCDLIGLPRPTVIEARRLIEKTTGIAGSNVMVSATHSHTGPVLTRGTVGDEIDGGNRDLAAQYTAELPQRIAQAVAEAHARRAPTRASFAREAEGRLAYCRRFWMEDGTVGWNPGKSNPGVLRPVSPVDPEVGVVYFETLAQEPQLTFVNFAMHPDTTGGTRVSADYMGALSRRLADYRGAGMMTLFANGACGNLNHLNVNWPRRQQGTNEANRLGTILAAAVFKAYMDLQPVSDPTLRVRSETVSLPLAKVSEDELREARAVMAKGKAAQFMEQVQAYKALDVQARAGQPYEVEVQVIALGRDVAWVSLPGEAFVELGLNIKAASPFRQTHVIELANGSIGYIPNRSAYAEGNYEVVSARVAEGAGERLVSAAARHLSDLHRSALVAP